MSDYTVVKGDTLSRIASANGMTVQQLLEANPDITDPNLIRIGQTVTIPDGQTPTPAASTGDAQVADDTKGFVVPGLQVAGPTPGTDVVGPSQAQSTIPTGMTLTIVNGARGSDTGQFFYLTGNLYGVTVAYEVGDKARVQELFGGIGSFDNIETMHQKVFDNRDILTVGTVDEILGSTESLQAQAARDMQAYGLENPPAWMVADQKAMFIQMTAVNEGWSAERTWDALSSTAAFKQRFVGLDTVMGQLGTSSLTAAIGEYQNREAAIRTALLSSRGPQTNVSTEYVASLVGSGWKPAEVTSLLSVEKRLRDNPAALTNMNDILVYQGRDPLSADDFVSFLTEQDRALTDPTFTPSQLFEGINDALRYQELLNEGLDVSLQFATSLGDGTSDTIADPHTFDQAARAAASLVAANANELDFAKMGLTKEDIIAAQFGDTPPSGKPVAEVTDILSRFVRERKFAAQGFSGGQSYIDAAGRLRVQGQATV